MNNVDNGWILTYTGKKFFPLHPDLDSICLEDIAHALSNMCRFTGHVKNFYSVAEHSVLVARGVYQETKDKPLSLKALLHDASEAYLCDIARPVKNTFEFNPYRNIELKLQNKIWQKFDVLQVFGDEIIKKWDEILLHNEAYLLMPNHPEFFQTANIPDEKVNIQCLSPKDAKGLFLLTFEALTR